VTLSGGKGAPAGRARHAGRTAAGG
jgi:hypothetical protein